MATRASYTDANQPAPLIALKTDRNAPCPCGSGLKFKKCHGGPHGVDKPRAAEVQTSALAHLAPDQLFAQALSHHQGGEFPSAAALYRELLTAHPYQADVHHNLGLVLLQMGKRDDAISHVSRAAKLDPSRAVFRASLGAVLTTAGRYAEAIEIFAPLRSTLDSSGLQNFAAAMGRLGRTSEALALCRQCLSLEPYSVDALGLLANLLTDLGDFSAADAAYAEALSLRSDAAVIFSNRLLMLNYSDQVEAVDLLAQHRAFGERHDGVWGQLPTLFSNERRLGRPLRLGLVSPDFGEHPVGYLIEPLIAELSREQFEIHLYSNRPHASALTDRLKARAASWCECHALADPELVARIRADGIDVLIDLAGHTSGNRLG